MTRSGTLVRLAVRRRLCACGGALRGPPQERHGREIWRRRRDTAGGVDAAASKSHLIDVAKRLDVRGRSRMNKDELVDTIRKANRATASARRARASRSACC